MTIIFVAMVMQFLIVLKYENVKAIYLKKKLDILSVSQHLSTFDNFLARRPIIQIESFGPSELA